MMKKNSDPNVVALNPNTSPRSATPSPDENTQQSQNMIATIFRELEGAVSKARNLEEALKTSQSTLLRAQTEFETNHRLRNDTDGSRARHYEQAYRTATEELKNLHVNASRKVQELEAKLKASTLRAEKLSQQLKSGAAKWNDLVSKVRTQNEQIASFRKNADQTREKLLQEAQFEKTRAAQAYRDLDTLRPKQQELQIELLETKKKLSTLEPELARYKAGWQQASRAIAERDKIIAALKQQQQQKTPIARPTVPPASGTPSLSDALKALNNLQEQRMQLQETIQSAESKLGRQAIEKPRAKPVVTVAAPASSGPSPARPQPSRLR